MPPRRKSLHTGVFCNISIAKNGLHGYHRLNKIVIKVSPTGCETAMEFLELEQNKAKRVVY
jgi:hypothetical protein